MINLEIANDFNAKQNRKTLLINCGDSLYYDYTNIFKSEDLNILTTLANSVPVLGKNNDFLSYIEYLINFLKTENIFVLGHSNCKLCASLYLPDNLFKNSPNLKKWIDQNKIIVDRISIKYIYHFLEEKLILTEHENIINQIKNLLTYPIINKLYKQKKLKISGYYHDFENNKLYKYNHDCDVFEIV